MRVPFDLSSRGEAPEADPRALELRDDRPEVERLFELALNGELPRSRELKAWEPQRLNERHLAMVTARASGLQQRTIAQAFGATDSNVSIVLNHPDAEFLLTKLQAMKATKGGTIEERLKALAEPAISTLEELFEGDEEGNVLPPVKRAPSAFRILEANGYGAKKKVEVEHQHRLTIDREQGAQLLRALRESREVEEQEVVIVDEVPALGPGGASTASPPFDGSQDTAAPSSSGSQDQEQHRRSA